MYGEVDLHRDSQQAIITFHLDQNENHSHFECTAINFYGEKKSEHLVKPCVVENWSRIHHTTWIWNLQKNDLLSMKYQGKECIWTFDGFKIKMLASCWPQAPTIKTLAKLKPVEPPAVF